MWFLSKRLEGIRKNSLWIIQRIFCFLYRVSCFASSGTIVATVSKRILWTCQGANTGNSCDIFCHQCDVSEPRRVEVFPKGAVSLLFSQPIPVILLKRMCFFHFRHAFLLCCFCYFCWPCLFVYLLKLFLTICFIHYIFRNKCWKHGYKILYYYPTSKLLGLKIGHEKILCNYRFDGV